MAELDSYEDHGEREALGRHSLIVPKQKPEPPSRTKVASKTSIGTAAGSIAKTLANFGTERVFGIPGGPISPVVDALLDTEIEHITCQHENMAVYAAGGEGLVRRKPGVVAVTSGPGILNAMTGLAACFYDHMPLILLVGEVATTNQGKGALQDGSDSALNVSQMVRSICKKTLLIEQPERAAEDIAEAWRIALQPPFGPVVVRIPVDIASRTVDCDAAKPRTVAAHPRHINKEKIERIAELLQNAERPVILAGGGVCRAQAYDELLALVESSRCAVMTDLEAKGAFPETHPLSLGIFGVGGDGRASSYLEQGVDLVLTLGARLDDTTTANFSPLLQPENGTLVQVDEDVFRLARSYHPDIALAGEPKAVCQAIQEELGSIQRPYPSVAAKEAVTATLQNPPYDPVSAIASIQSKLPADTVFVSDIGNHLLFASQALTLDQPECFHASLGLGGMGSGIGRAIGLQAAYGRTRQVVCICGDGSYLMSGNEIATCARYEIPVIFLVVNDGQLGMVQHGNERVLGRSPDLSTPAVDLALNAYTLGVEASSLEDALSSDLSYRLGPRLIEAVCDSKRKAVNARESTVNFPELQRLVAS